eukprot:GHVP01033296.1.p1 GENE.GHVP01033296.1~~GHVP01033296.1.p1  ORF type:complete len:717 (+),score=96.52 GHVP01033296.1:1498-3648(+)
MDVITERRWRSEISKLENSPLSSSGINMEICQSISCQLVKRKFWIPFLNKIDKEDDERSLSEIKGGTIRLGLTGKSLGIHDFRDKELLIVTIEATGLFPFEAPFLITEHVEIPVLAKFFDLKEDYLRNPTLFTQDVLGESWSPKLTLEDLIGRLTLFLLSRKLSHRVSIPTTDRRPFLSTGGLAAMAFGLLVLIRLLAGLAPYSGMASPPKFGDFEAHRHWMEITNSLPVSEWYLDSSRNNLQYWGIDYPPLSAYHAKLIGLIGSLVLGKSPFLLGTSHGYESESLTIFMRLVNVFAEIIVLWPAVWKLTEEIFCRIYVFMGSSRNFKDDITRKRIILSFIVLLSPPLLFIDHMHFQFNNISLGALIWSLVFFARQQFSYSLSAYLMAVLFKQTFLYLVVVFGGAFVSTLIVDIFRIGTFRFRYVVLKSTNEAQSRFLRLISVSFVVGLVTLLPFFVVEIPRDVSIPTGESFFEKIAYAIFGKSSYSLFAILHRVFPVNRGLYEDLPSNFWVLINPIFKAKKLAESFRYRKVIVQLCTVATCCSQFRPLLILASTQNLKSLISCLVQGSLGFFLFSYHVHEKAILIPVFLCSFLIPYERTMGFSTILILVSSSSLVPLALQEGSLLSFLSVIFTFAIATLQLSQNFQSDFKPLRSQLTLKKDTIHQILAALCAVCSVLYTLFICAQIPPLPNYPYLWKHIHSSIHSFTFIFTYVMF